MSDSDVTLRGSRVLEELPKAELSDCSDAVEETRNGGRYLSALPEWLWADVRSETNLTTPPDTLSSGLRVPTVESGEWGEIG